MKYFAFTKSADQLKIVSALLCGGDLLTHVDPAPENIDPESIKKLEISDNDRIIVADIDDNELGVLLESLDKAAVRASMVTIDSGGGCRYQSGRQETECIDLVALASSAVEQGWKKIETKRKVLRLRSALKLEQGEKLAILVQNDPDPDAIGSALALRAITGLEPAKAPIVTFGEVTRSENVAMLRLLHATVNTIRPAELLSYAKIAMVDVSPRYFADMEIGRISAVIDHHPYPPDDKIAFTEIDESAGSTSTIFHEMLESFDIKIDQRLATGLTYGIITDTAFLSREATLRDHNAFTSLWPKINTHMLASMSRPRLSREDLQSFDSAIRRHLHIRGITFAWLGTITREDIVPRLADFTLQFGQSVWSVVGGLLDEKVIISIRYVGNDWDAGALAELLFDEYGSAGGHKSMAKAVFPANKFMEKNDIKNIIDLPEKIAMLFEENTPPLAKRHSKELG